jgi:hypothetical protein
MDEGFGRKTLIYELFDSLMPKSVSCCYMTFFFFEAAQAGLKLKTLLLSPKCGGSKNMLFFQL